MNKGVPTHIPIVSLAPRSEVRHLKRRSPAGRPLADYCKRGHALVLANLYFDPRGRRRCLTCRKGYDDLRYRERTQKDP